MEQKIKLLSAVLFASTITSAIAQTTANYIPRWNGTSFVNTVTPIFEDVTNSRIGIGTVLPGVTLDVQGTNPQVRVKIPTGGTSTSYSAFVAEGNVGSVNFVQLMGGNNMGGTLFGLPRASMGQLYTNNAPLVIGTAAAADLTLGANNQALMTFKSTGKIGVGTASPDDLFQVGNGNTKVVFGSIFTSLGTEYVGFNVSHPNLWSTAADGIHNGGALIFGNSSGDLLFSNIPNTGTSGQSGITDATISSNIRFMIANGGNVGVGTTSPSTLFHVKSAANIDAEIRIEVSSGAKKSILGLANTGADWGQLYFDNSNNNLVLRQMVNQGYLGFGTNSRTADMIITNGGNVLINQTTQVNTAYKLDVNGYVRATKIVVNTTGADFVFEKGYQLMPLKELEQSIKKNKHLPCIPSASEMQTLGEDVGELNTTLLQKVEELTLYIIEQNKRIEELEKRIQ